MNNDLNHLLHSLQDLKNVRAKAQKILVLARENKLAHFSVNDKKKQKTADFVVDVIYDNYPTLAIPYHSRWRHFQMDGENRIQPFQSSGKMLFELVILSVLLDAGAGSTWSYQDKGQVFSRSEGLALASLNLYRSGTLSRDTNEPFRVDAVKLIEWDEEKLKKGFQISAKNPLIGIPGRVSLLNCLGNVIQKNPLVFAEGRLGNFFSYIIGLAKDNTLSVKDIFQEVLNTFSPIWPTRLCYGGTSLGDVGIHTALKSEQFGSEYVPFHKLSQWLTYSLLEPLEWAGVQIKDLNVLTALPEYRNGGLLLDMGFLEVKDQRILQEPQVQDSEGIVEWRALTIALLDELAETIRQKLKLNEIQLPLAKILQGGTWEAGRRIAKIKRKNAAPPITIQSDGTLF